MGFVCRGSSNWDGGSCFSNGWLSKIWSFFGYPKYSGPYYNRDPKRDHNFDSHPNGALWGYTGPPLWSKLNCSTKILGTRVGGALKV